MEPDRAGWGWWSARSSQRRALPAGAVLAGDKIHGIKPRRSTYLLTTEEENVRANLICPLLPFFLRCEAARVSARPVPAWIPDWLSVG